MADRAFGSLGLPEVDPVTGAVIPSDAAQGKFGRIADAVGGGLRQWFETPGRAYKEGITPEEAVDWAAPTAFGMLGVGAPNAMTGAVGIGGGKLIRGGGTPEKAFDFSNPGGGTRVANLGGTEVTYGVGRDGVELTLVRTNKDARNQGSARAALEQFVSEADDAGVELTLNADPMERGVSKGRLVDFYKSLGFQRNAGRKRDFSTRAEFIRDPLSFGSLGPKE